MAIRRAAIAAAIGGAILAAWRLSGLVLVAPSSGSSAVILAAGPAAILWQAWPALVASSALAVLALAGVLDRAARRATTADQADALNNLHEDIQRNNQERENLRRARDIIEENERAFAGRRKADEDKIKAINAARSHQEREVDRLRHELERAKGDLAGARKHIKRIKCQKINHR